MIIGVYLCECGFSVVLRISSCLCLPEKHEQRQNPCLLGSIAGEFQCTGILHGFRLLI